MVLISPLFDFELTILLKQSIVYLGFFISFFILIGLGVASS